MKVSVAGAAEQREVVDVGMSASRRIVGNDVVRFAPLVVRVAENARLISGDQRKALAGCGGPLGAAQP